MKEKPDRSLEMGMYAGFCHAPLDSIIGIPILMNSCSYVYMNEQTEVAKGFIMTESPNHIVQEAESIVNAADAPSANSVDPSRANTPSPSEEACPCGCNREKTSCLFDEMPDEELLYDLADLFKVFADTTRIKILYALMGHNRCVADIAEIVGATQSAVSHQLRTLKQARLVKFQREGKNVIYSLSDNHVYTMLAQGMTHICE